MSTFDPTARVDLEAAWVDREREAGHLRAAGYRSMAVALRCYALEIRLKAIICRHLKLEFLPKACRTHDLLGLIIFTGLWAELYDQANAQVQIHWDILVRFGKERLNDLRYQPRAQVRDGESNAIDLALDEPIHGIHAWLSRPR